MYVCTNDSCAMYMNKLADQAASALKFKCPVCRQSLQADSQYDQPDVDVSGFPSVIALPLKEYHKETNPVLKLWYACDVIELTLRLMVIVGLADIKDLRKELPKTLLREFQPRIDQPTLGKWKGMCLAVAKHLPVGQSRILELQETLTKSLIPFLDGTERKRTPETSFSALRNQLAHGGGVTKVVASRLLEIWKDKFEEVVVACSWLRNFALVVKMEPNAFGVLCGPTSNPTLYTPQGDAEQQTLDSVFERGDEVAFVREQVVVPLWPMSIYGLPSLSDPEAPVATSPIPQIYVRRGEVFLQFTPVGSEELCQSEGDQSSLSAFLDFFRFRELEAENQQSGFMVRGFERDLRKDADRLVGRMEELRRIHGVMEQTTSGVLWLAGAAGIGKSFTISRITVDLLENQQAENCCILPFRFRASDDRCSRLQFLRFAIERLNAWKPLENEAQKDKDQKKPIDEFKDLLGRLPKEKRIIFILDGLDELAEHDSTFAQEIPLSLSFEGVLWLCAGRPERGLPEAFIPERCQHIFQEGLSPMSIDDIRTMLIEKIGPLRRKLVANDSELDGTVVNPFVNKVAQSAQGFPLYVTYVIGDVLSGRLRALDAGERLPPTLSQYHAELLRRCALGILNQILTPIASTLAVSHEPLCISSILEILQTSTLLPEDENSKQLLKRALLAMGSMLKRSKTVGGKDGYQLYHHSLCQHMIKSPEMKPAIVTSLKNLTNIFKNWKLIKNENLKQYVIKNGIKHIIEMAKYSNENYEPKEFIEIVLDYDLILERSKIPGQRSWSIEQPIFDDYMHFINQFSEHRRQQLAETFWKYYLECTLDMKYPGQWLRRFIVSHGNSVLISEKIAKNKKIQDLVINCIGWMVSGQGYQQEAKALNPAYFVSDFIKFCGKAGEVQFLERVKEIKLPDYISPNPFLTSCLWEQDISFMFNFIQDALNEAIGAANNKVH